MLEAVIVACRVLLPLLRFFSFSNLNKEVLIKSKKFTQFHIELISGLV